MAPANKPHDMWKSIYSALHSLHGREKMGVLQIVLPDDIEKRLRVAVAERGGKKGDLSGSVEEAILAWLKNLDSEPERKEKRK